MNKILAKNISAVPATKLGAEPAKPLSALPCQHSYDKQTDGSPAKCVICGAVQDKKEVKEVKPKVVKEVKPATEVKPPKAVKEVKPPKEVKEVKEVKPPKSVKEVSGVAALVSGITTNSAALVAKLKDLDKLNKSYGKIPNAAFKSQQVKLNTELAKIQLRSMNEMLSLRKAYDKEQLKSQLQHDKEKAYATKSLLRDMKVDKVEFGVLCSNARMQNNRFPSIADALKMVRKYEGALCLYSTASSKPVALTKQVAKGSEPVFNAVGAKYAVLLNPIGK